MSTANPRSTYAAAAEYPSTQGLSNCFRELDWNKSLHIQRFGPMRNIGSKVSICAIDSGQNGNANLSVAVHVLHHLSNHLLRHFRTV